MTPREYLGAREREVRRALRSDAKQIVVAADERLSLSRHIRESPWAALALGTAAGALIGRFAPRISGLAGAGLRRGGGAALGAVMRDLFRGTSGEAEDAD